MENEIKIDWNDREAVKELFRTEEGAKRYCGAPDFIRKDLELGIIACVNAGSAYDGGVFMPLELKINIIKGNPFYFFPYGKKNEEKYMDFSFIDEINNDEEKLLEIVEIIKKNDTNGRFYLDRGIGMNFHDASALHILFYHVQFPKVIISLLEKYPHYYEYLNDEMKKNKEIMAFMSTKERFYYTIRDVREVNIDENLVRELIKYDYIKLGYYGGIDAKFHLANYEDKIRSILLNDTDLFLPLVKNGDLAMLSNWQWEIMERNIPHNLDFGKIALECLKHSIDNEIEENKDVCNIDIPEIKGESNVYNCPGFEILPRVLGEDTKLNLEAQKIVLDTLIEHKQKHPDKIEKQGNYWNASCFCAIFTIASHRLLADTEFDIDEERKFCFETLSNALNTENKNYDYRNIYRKTLSMRKNYRGMLEFIDLCYEDGIAYKIVQDLLDKGENDFVGYILDTINSLNIREDKLKTALERCKERGNTTEDLNKIIDVVFKNVKLKKSEDNFGL